MLQVLSVAHAVDLNEEMARAAQSGALSVRGRVLHKPRISDSPRELGECDLRLQPRQGRSVTVVDAAAEAEVRVVRTIGIELFRVVESGRVPAPGSEQEDHCRAPRDRSAGNGDIVEGRAAWQHLD